MVASKVLAAICAIALHSQPALGRIGKGWQDLTKDTFNEFITSNERAMVDFYDPADNDWPHHRMELEAALVQVRSYGNTRVPFAKVDASTEVDLAKQYVKNGRYPQLMWFVHGKPTQYHRTLRTAKMISDFVMALDRPAVTKIEKFEEARDFNRAVLGMISKTSKLYKVLEIVAQKHMDTIAFTYMESSEEKIKYIEDNKEPVEFTGEATVDALEKFVKGRLPFKSEEIPTGEDAMDGYTTMIGHNFEEKMLQKEKDVMLLVHAPWCGFCKKLQPSWDSLARTMKDVPHVLIAKMDGSRNESPLPFDFSWDAYPTIFYVRAGENWPTVYRGNRTVESLLAFMKEHATKPINLDPTQIVSSDSDL
jgi:protein disulfide-isomerase-like protein